MSDADNGRGGSNQGFEILDGPAHLDLENPKKILRKQNWLTLTLNTCIIWSLT